MQLHADEDARRWRDGATGFLLENVFLWLRLSGLQRVELGDVGDGDQVVYMVSMSVCTGFLVILSF